MKLRMPVKFLSMRDNNVLVGIVEEILRSASSADVQCSLETFLEMVSPVALG